MGRAWTPDLPSKASEGMRRWQAPRDLVCVDCGAWADDCRCGDQPDTVLWERRDGDDAA